MFCWVHRRHILHDRRDHLRALRHLIRHSQLRHPRKFLQYFIIVVESIFEVARCVVILLGFKVNCALFDAFPSTGWPRWNFYIFIICIKISHNVLILSFYLLFFLYWIIFGITIIQVAGDDIIISNLA